MPDAQDQRARRSREILTLWLRSGSTPSGVEVLKRLSGREKRYQQWLNHNISSSIINEAVATNSIVATLDLTGIRGRTNEQPRNKTERSGATRREVSSPSAKSVGRVPRLKGTSCIEGMRTPVRRSNSWAFYQLRTFLEYKGISEGVKVVAIPPAYTSQVCHKCLHIHPVPGKSYRSGKTFKCCNCNNQCDADYNGAKMIELWGASVTAPRGSELLSCAIVLGLPKAHTAKTQSSVWVGYQQSLDICYALSSQLESR